MNKGLMTEDISRLYNHYKFYHFFAICFGLGVALIFYRPFYSIIAPLGMAVFFTAVFEIVGLFFDLPAHTKKCKGKPYDGRDSYLGFCVALAVAFIWRDIDYVYTLSYGWGITTFAVRGAIRKYISLWEQRQPRHAQW